ncbi:hypothetical protein [Flavivirga sp. 57AJ16]|uniref:hypothetical protein n=1 Tax=Flavivirga sp. 57AJ16 TaxID=3025307 RepID=UPI0023654B4B|nr:hypothetical protein [Flavivirga sp. 57AJ16]MDD7885281.1 hypothetical protein [Flavivirga sp. 57AJ16]
MKNTILIVLISLVCSCGKDKILHLPEVDHSEISEINDVSPAYLFYDTTQKDSVELNRKNLISTTNWLVNVDKRLTLKQAIPHIKFLQDKKQNSSHKNKNAKNYFTCNDISKKNLGFIDFTDVVYIKKSIINVLADNHSIPNNTLIIHFDSSKNIKINSFFDKINITHSNISELNHSITSLSENKNNASVLLCFDDHLSFNEYILFKSVLSRLKSKSISISKNEFISN